MGEPGRREIRLRSGYAELYPDMPRDTWLPVSQWVEAVVTRSHRARRSGEPVRTFDARHFEFRGGSPPRTPGERHLHTRAEDQ